MKSTVVWRQGKVPNDDDLDETARPTALVCYMDGIREAGSRRVTPSCITPCQGYMVAVDEVGIASKLRARSPRLPADTGQVMYASSCGIQAAHCNYVLLIDWQC